MQVVSKKFSILITTKNRLEDLVYTLHKIQYLIEKTDVECVIFDDGSTDGTYEFVKENFPEVKLERNPYSKGYLYCRNKMLNETRADFAISLDDDAHFVTEQPLELIANYFDKNPKVGLLGFRVFWSKQNPSSIFSSDLSIRMKSFVGCAHVWRMSAWRAIPNYPEWFVFYGEEDFASYQLFKKNWAIDYLPELLVHHRVDLKARKDNTDYSLRLRRSLCSGWNLYFLFLPLPLIPKKMAYSIWMQLQLKVFKGDWKALKGLLLALMDLLFALPKIINNRNRLTGAEYEAYQKLPETRLYWKPEEEATL
ncbi:glycosyltransferase family 2 protein [Flavobacterium sinopsychrotolerans]|uniref:Glycosyltransferase, GT2 family n=1 Tax=Flavobacterium sinopsychrotolerans TaxID=604089 RepID=A0A1H8RLY4_9FLAO|nr:glycosyltransferase [Flavobacterium sinopsychrotolerans]SEO67184.1 Glycosyltransferase, GT2 family [Flavobacterium sinopsychrotolerans]